MERTERLDRLLDSFILRGVPGCALAVFYRGKTVYSGYRGYARLEDHKKIDPNTVYRIASCTKNITATAAMVLFEEGKLLLNDPVSEYLPKFRDIPYQTADASGEIVRRPTSRPLLIRDLLTMTSGIPYMGEGSLTGNHYLKTIGSMFDMYRLTLQELAEKVAEVPLEFDPGTHWKYGLSFDILAAVIEVVSQMSFGEYLRRTIFEPLEMHDTTFVCKKDMLPDLADVYMHKDGKSVNIHREPNITETNGNKLESGGGGLLSTLSDLLAFSGMWGQGGVWKNKRILGRKTIDLMRRNHLRGTALEDFRKMAEQAYPWYAGYGWGLAGRTMVDCLEAGSNGSVGEFGWCGAYGPYIMADPEKQLGVVYTHQMAPVIGGMQDFCHPRVRNAVYSLLDDWDN